MKFRPRGKKLKCKVNLRTFGIKPFLSKDIIQHPFNIPSASLWKFRIMDCTSWFPRHCVFWFIKYKGSSKKNSFWTKWRCVSITYQPVLGWWCCKSGCAEPNQMSLWNPKWSKTTCSAAKILHLVDSHPSFHYAFWSQFPWVAEGMTFAARAEPQVHQYKLG